MRPLLFTYSDISRPIRGNCKIIRRFEGLLYSIRVKANLPLKEVLHNAERRPSSTVYGLSKGCVWVLSKQGNFVAQGQREWPTSTLQNTLVQRNGGRYRIRTCDPVRVMHVL